MERSNSTVNINVLMPTGEPTVNINVMPTGEPNVLMPTGELTKASTPPVTNAVTTPETGLTSRVRRYGVGAMPQACFGGYGVGAGIQRTEYPAHLEYIM
jgi:hypothetical protein